MFRTNRQIGKFAEQIWHNLSNFNFLLDLRYKRCVELGNKTIVLLRRPKIYPLFGLKMCTRDFFLVSIVFKCW